jgi:toxin ParE1/3/4
MSARRPSVTLRPTARRDFRSILAYTTSQWGTAQRDEYRAAINRALETLGANPEIGKAREDLSPGLRSYQVEQHVIYYRITGNTARVLRILHGKMDAARYLDE